MVNRRTALKQMSGIAGSVMLAEGWMGKGSSETVPNASALPIAAVEETAPFTLPALPYAYDALEPSFDAETMHLHHDKHHQAYVDNANKALEGTDWADESVEQVLTILETLPADKQRVLRNNAGGHANHSFFWEIMSPGFEGPVQNAVALGINETHYRISASNIHTRCDGSHIGRPRAGRAKACLIVRTPGRRKTSSG